MPVSAPGFIAGTGIGLSWQATEGEAVPGTPYLPAQFIVAESFERDPDPVHLSPNGTHGSIHRRYDGERIVAQAFKKEIRFWGSRFQIMPFLESVMGGQPTLAFADSTVSGAGAAQVTAISFIGIRPHHNTSPYISTPATLPKLYGRLTGAGFPVTVNIYKDSARTQLVATASVSAAATPTALTESGSSGLTGSVTLSAAGTNDFEIQPNKIVYAFATQHARYFRLFYSDSKDAYVLSDCVVHDFMMESSENGALDVTAMIMGKRRTVSTGQTLAVLETQLDLAAYSHHELTLTKDPAGSPILPIVDQFGFGIKNDVLQYVGNAPTPQKLIKRGWIEMTGSIRGEQADETRGLLTDARANATLGAGFQRMKAEYLLASKTFSVDLQKAKMMLAEPGLDGPLVNKVELDYQAFYDGSTVPAAISIQV